MGTRAVLTIKTNEDISHSCLIHYDGGYAVTGLSLVTAYILNTNTVLSKRLESISWIESLPTPTTQLEARNETLAQIKYNGKGNQVLSILEGKDLDELTDPSLSRFMTSFGYEFNGEMFDEVKPEGADDNRIIVNNELRIGIMDINPDEYESIEFVYVLDLVMDTLSIYTLKNDEITNTIGNKIKVNSKEYVCVFCLNRDANNRLIPHLFEDIDDIQSHYWELEQELNIPWEKIALRDFIRESV